mmetsp:Transcript_34011/g.74305  ORF Transcript_34011/g.74305 Transcript_34011/m.74305 type:complete len:595 (-) Transcript_34011:1157-2941(-)
MRPPKSRFLNNLIAIAGANARKPLKSPQSEDHENPTTLLVLALVGGPHSREKPIRRQQLLWRTALHQRSLAHHEYDIAGDDCVQPVRNSNHGAGCEFPLDHRLDPPVRVPVHVASGLIQTQDLPRDQQRASKTHELLLPGTEPRPGAVDCPVEQLLGVVICKARVAQSGLNLCIAVLPPRVQIAPHGALHQHGVLGDRHHSSAQAKQPNSAKSHPVNSYATVARVDQSEQACHQATLAASSPPHDSRLLAALDRKRYPLESQGQVGLVPHLDRVVLQGTTRRPRLRGVVGHLAGRLLLHLQVVQQPLHRGHEHFEHGVDAGDHGEEIGGQEGVGQHHATLRWVGVLLHKEHPSTNRSGDHTRQQPGQLPQKINARRRCKLVTGPLIHVLHMPLQKEHFTVHQPNQGLGLPDLSQVRKHRGHRIVGHPLEVSVNPVHSPREHQVKPHGHHHHKDHLRDHDADDSDHSKQTGGHVHSIVRGERHLQVDEGQIGGEPAHNTTLRVGLPPRHRRMHNPLRGQPMQIAGRACSPLAPQRRPDEQAQSENQRRPGVDTHAHAKVIALCSVSTVRNPLRQPHVPKSHSHVPHHSVGDAQSQ